MNLVSLLRYLLTSFGGATLAAGVVFLAMCIPKCYGLAEAIYGIYAGAIAWTVLFLYLIFRHHQVAQDKLRLERQARMQWWFVAACSVFMLAILSQL